MIILCSFWVTYGVSMASLFNPEKSRFSPLSFFLVGGWQCKVAVDPPRCYTSSHQKRAGGTKLYGSSLACAIVPFLTQDAAVSGLLYRCDSERGKSWMIGMGQQQWATWEQGCVDAVLVCLHVACCCSCDRGRFFLPLYDSSYRECKSLANGLLLSSFIRDAPLDTFFYILFNWGWDSLDYGLCGNRMWKVQSYNLWHVHNYIMLLAFGFFLTGLRPVRFFSSSRECGQITLSFRNGGSMWSAKKNLAW